MTRAALLRPAACLILVAVLVGSPFGSAGGFESADAGTFELQRDLRTLRGRVERAPRPSSFDLLSLQRRVRAQRTEDPRDPRLQELALEIDRLRAKADRAARRLRVGALLPSRSALGTSMPIATPGYSDAAPTPVAAPSARPYLGQRVVTLQRSAAEIERRLEHGDTAAAARLLEAIEAELATLRAVFSSVVAQDPNVIALEGQIRALEHRLQGD
jgi:hypothetical protein